MLLRSTLCLLLLCPALVGSAPPNSPSAAQAQRPKQKQAQPKKAGRRKPQEPGASKPKRKPRRAPTTEKEVLDLLRQMEALVVEGSYQIRPWTAPSSESERLVPDLTAFHGATAGQWLSTIERAESELSQIRLSLIDSARAQDVRWLLTWLRSEKFRWSLRPLNHDPLLYAEGLQTCLRDCLPKSGQRLSRARLEALIGRLESVDTHWRYARLRIESAPAFWFEMAAEQMEASLRDIREIYLPLGKKLKAEDPKGLGQDLIAACESASQATLRQKETWEGRSRTGSNQYEPVGKSKWLAAMKQATGRAQDLDELRLSLLRKIGEHASMAALKSRPQAGSDDSAIPLNKLENLGPKWEQQWTRGFSNSRELAASLGWPTPQGLELQLSLLPGQSSNQAVSKNHWLSPEELLVEFYLPAEEWSPERRREHWAQMSPQALLYQAAKSGLIGSAVLDWQRNYATNLTRSRMPNHWRDKAYGLYTSLKFPDYLEESVRKECRRLAHHQLLLESARLLASLEFHAADMLFDDMTLLIANVAGLDIRSARREALAVVRDPFVGMPYFSFTKIIELEELIFAKRIDADLSMVLKLLTGNPQAPLQFLLNPLKRPAPEAR